MAEGDGLGDSLLAFHVWHPILDARLVPNPAMRVRMCSGGRDKQQRAHATFYDPRSTRARGTALHGPRRHRNLCFNEWRSGIGTVAMSDERPAGQRSNGDDGPPDAAHTGTFAAIDGNFPAEGATCSANGTDSARGTATDETPSTDDATPPGSGRPPLETPGSGRPLDFKSAPLSDRDAVTSSQAVDKRERKVNVPAPDSQSGETHSRASSTRSRALPKSQDSASAAGEEDSEDDRSHVESGDEQRRASEGPPRDASRPGSEQADASMLINRLRLENKSLIGQIRNADQALSRALQLRQSEAAELKRRRRTATGPTRYPILAALAERAPPAAQARAHDTLQRHQAMVSRMDRLKEENAQLEGKRNGIFAHGDPRALANRVAELDGVLASLRDENRLLRQATGRQQSNDPSLAVSWERCANLERSVRQAKQEAASTASQLASRRQAASQFWKHYWRVQVGVALPLPPRACACLVPSGDHGSPPGRCGAQQRVQGRACRQQWRRSGARRPRASAAL